MSVLDEAVKWGMRALRLLPEFMGLWEATKAKDSAAQLEKNADLIAAMEREQAIEEMGGGS